MRRRLVMPTVAIVMAIAMSGLAGPAEATQCKGAMNGDGFSQSQAESSWVSAVKHRYGSAWANFGKARNKRYSELSVPPEPLQIVTASPCK